MIVNYSKFGYFGKLPQFSDFVDFNANTVEFRDFDLWLQEGLFFSKTRLAQNWDRIFLLAPSYNFAYRVSNSSLLCGIIRPSRDKGGRNYPFVVFTGVSFENQFTFVSLLYKILAVGLLEKFHHFLMETTEFGKPQELRDKLIEIENVTKKTKDPDALANDDFFILTMTSFLEKFYDAPLKKKMQTILDELVATLRPSQGKKVGRSVTGLSFPLNRQFGVSNSVLFWLQLVEILVSGKTMRPYIFWSKSSLYVFLQKPKVQFLLQFLQPSNQCKDICFLDNGSLNHKSSQLSKKIVELGCLDDLTQSEFFYCINQSVSEYQPSD